MAKPLTEDARTALVILPPDELMMQVQSLRRRHDRAFDRWPPHLRICWPFLPLRTGLARLNQLRTLGTISFEVELSQVGLLTSGSHGDKDRTYIVLKPSFVSSKRLEELCKEVHKEVFPEYAAEFTSDFHLTIGQLPWQEAENLLKSDIELLQLPIVWHCDKLVLMACDSSTEPLKPVQELPLRSVESFSTPSRKEGGLPSSLPSLVWRGVVEALHLRDAALLARAVAHQEIPGNADWWPEMIQNFFCTDGASLSGSGISTFSSLAGAAGFAASLSVVAATKDKAFAKDLCKGVRHMQDDPSASTEILSLPFSGPVSCMRQNDKRLLAVGEISKESGLSLWNLNALKEKPRFSKLKGHIKNVDLWEELLLALSKGGGLSVHDLNDPRSQPTLLSKRDDGQALDVHWIGGRALAAFSNKVALINVENGHAEYLNVPALRDPAVSPLGPHVAVAGPSSCMLWDLRRSVTAVEMAWPGGFTCRTLARLVSDHTLVAGGFGQVPLHYMDLRMPSNLPTYPVPRLPSSGLLEIQRLLTGNPCVSAQFQDRSLATWHLDTGTLLGWWPSSRCLSIPSGTAAIAWPGIAAADDGHAYVALPGKRAVGGSGTSAPMMRQRKEGLKGGKGKEGGQVKMQGPKAAPSKAPRKDSQKSQETEAPREEESQRSQKLRTSEDVYHRILHDSRFDPKEVSIGYEDRFLGPMEVKLLDFQPGGDIPLHRIYYFRRGAEVLWDRKHRLDRIFNAEAAEAAPETVEAIQKARRTAEKIEQGIIKVRGRRGSNKVTPKEEAGMKYYRDEGCWVQAPATHFVQLTELKVLTLNVLFELFGDVKTHMEVRMAHMFQELERAQADILLLQEVTPSFVQTILAQHWVRDHYWSSCGDIDTASVNPSGQLTLSRLPMRSVVCARISQHKTVILATMSLSFRSKEVAVVIANLHLTADLNDASGTRRNHRVEQLQTCEALINDRLQPGDLGLIAGDFNDSAPAISSNFIDVWDRDEGYTFDPRVNTVAQHVVAAVGGCKDPRRIDRIYVGSGSWQFHAELFATEPFRLEDASKPDQEDQAWYISDHFGVLCRFWCEDSLGDTSNGDEQVLLQKPAAVLESNVLRAITLQDIESVSVELFLLGSAALGISDSGSDVDVLACSSSISSTKFFDLASEALQQHGIGPVDRAMDATVPLLKFQAGDVHIEVQFTELSAEQIAELRCSHTNAATDPVIANAAANAAFKSLEAILFTQSPQCQVGLAAALDAWALSRQLRRRFEHFRALTVEVKHWARHRQLLGTSFGFPGGFAWALLASKEVLGSSEDILASSARLRASFFKHLVSKFSQDVPSLWCPAGPQDRNALRSMTRGTAKILKAQLELATRDHTAAVGDVFQSPQFLVMELAVPGGKHILQRKAIPMLLEAERVANGLVWPLKDVHCSRRGRPCIVMGCHGWIPTAGEQTAVEKSIKVSTGLNPKVNLVSADKLMMEIPSCTRMFDREAASVP